MMALMDEEYMLNCQMAVKIGDLGFAKEAKGMISSHCGTPLNMAPEVLDKRIYDYKADIWSLGTLIFEMFVG